MEVTTKIKDALTCAIIGEVANRSISFLVGKWRNNRMSPTEEQRLESLRWLLLRVHAIVEEADGRHITNLAMLQQLKKLKMELHRGYYTLDTFSFGAPDDEGDKLNDVHQVSHSSALQSNFSSPAKRLRVGGGSGNAHELQRVLASLKAAIEHVGAEFATLCGRYPRLFRQPYSVYLLVDRFMFDRQLELEHVVDFLLQEADQARLGVLPIVGPGKVGKSTLVHHASADDRVRGHFSRIIFFSADDDLTTLDSAITGAADQRVLIIVELDVDIQEGSWRRLCSASKGRRRVACGSKIIVTSRSDRIASLGTALPLKLRFLTPEAYWYFFKVRTFGSTDVADHQNLASIGMEIARELNGCFVATNILRGVLKSSMNARFWSLVLATFREFRQKNPFLFSVAQPVDTWEAGAPVRVPTPRKKSTCPDRYSFMILGNYETASFHSEAEAPAVTVGDVLYGGARPRGKFDLLASKSHLPPYYNYLFNCEVRKPRRVVTRRKRN